MIRLASYIMSGRWQALSVIAGFAVLAWVVPPVMLISGAALSLHTLRHGAGAGAMLLGLAMLVTAGLSYFLGQHLMPWLILSNMVQWSPLLILALVWRYTLSLVTTLRAALAMGFIGLLSIKLFVPDLNETWFRLLELFVRPMFVQAQMPAEQIDSLLLHAASVMTGSMIAIMLLTQILSLLLARWWQALLYNPGGFRQEFTSLSLGRNTALFGVILFIGTLVSNEALVTELAVVGLSLFIFQGLAVIHEISGRSSNPMVWLVGMYLLLTFALPQMMTGLVATGVIDNFANLRRRFTR